MKKKMKNRKVTLREARRAWNEFGLSFGFREANEILDAFMEPEDDPRIAKLTPAQRRQFVHQVNTLGQRLAGELGRGLSEYEAYLAQAAS